MSNNHTFIVKQGKTFQRRLEYWSGSPPQRVNLSDFEARMQIRPQFNSNVVYCSLSTSIGPDGSGLTKTPLSASVTLPATSGSIGITISAYSSSQFTWTEGFFDLEIYSGSGVSEYVQEVLRGKFKVLPEVTK